MAKIMSSSPVVPAEMGMQGVFPRFMATIMIAKSPSPNNLGNPSFETKYKGRQDVRCQVLPVNRGCSHRADLLSGIPPGGYRQSITKMSCRWPHIPGEGLLIETLSSGRGKQKRESRNWPCPELFNVDCGRSTALAVSF